MTIQYDELKAQFDAILPERDKAVAALQTYQQKLDAANAAIGTNQTLIESLQESIRQLEANVPPAGITTDEVASLVTDMKALLQSLADATAENNPNN